MPRRCSTSWEHRMRCSKCGTEGIPGKKFCAECGNPLSNRCSKCHSDNAPGLKFCADCGRELGKDVGVDDGKPFAAGADGGVRIAPERQTSEAVDGERKTVTALFADIKGSTELMRDLDPEEARAIVDPALKLMIDAAHRYDGYVVQSTGDGIFALFGAPVAHEDHPQRALHAAIAMRGALRRSGEELKKQGRSGVEFRIGINTGEVVLRMIHTGGHTEYTPVGHAANLAARMQGAAPAGGIVISEDTRRLVEAGTGKSRLFYEFKATMPAECKVLEAYSVSHGKASAWLPVLELLYRYFGIDEADGKSERRAKIEARLSGLDPTLSDTLPLLYTLMGLHEGADPIAHMDPQIKLRRTLEAIKRIILRESLNQPLVVIFEDLHWIDSQTQELLDLLTESIANARVLLLFNYRPEYRHQWTNKSYYTQLRLDTLSEEGAAAMLSALLGEGVELAPLKRLVIERTEGNPFFIEEMVQALVDEGALVRNGLVRVARSLAQLRLPSTVQGILAARIDRLSAEQKDLLQTLAVMGRE